MSHLKPGGVAATQVRGLLDQRLIVACECTQTQQSGWIGWR
jgi:hypothetical protein